MIAEQRNNIISAFWKGFAAALATPAALPPEIEEKDVYVWTPLDVAGNLRVEADGMNFVKLGNMVFTQAEVMTMELSGTGGGSTYTFNLLGCYQQDVVCLAMYEVAGMDIILVSIPYAVDFDGIIIPEMGTYIIDIWQLLPDAELTMRLVEVGISSTAITWGGNIGNLPTVQADLDGTPIYYVRMSDKIPSRNLSDYHSVSCALYGEVQTIDISDGADSAEYYKTLVDDSYIAIAFLFAYIVLVDSVDIDGVVLTKGVWFLYAEEEGQTLMTNQITGNFTHED